MKPVEELFLRRRRERRPHLDFARSLSKSLGDPHAAFPTIHVTGTNGKGSVCVKIAKVLENQGCKVGLFTSPHIRSFSERISINGVEISEIKGRLESLLNLFSDATFFELMTFVAFDYFREQNIDIGVIEVGIGGLFDPTNVITPRISVITSVALDHQELLGNTLEEIAEQKAGIIKPQIPLVIGPQADFLAIRKQAVSCHSKLYKVEPPDGDYDLENQVVAKQALQLLGCTDFKGLETRPPCRFEVLGNVILDVAHNPAGFQKLMNAYDLHFPHEPFSAVVGMSRGKDVKKCLHILAQRARHLYLVEARSPHSFPVAAMEPLLRQEGFNHFTAGLTISESLKKVLSRQERMIVCGSFYIMEEARDILRVQVS